jgi:hypothetical protein
MLPLYLNSIAKRQFTIAYRGYDLDVTRALSGWRVGVHPKTADLPILARNEVNAPDQDQAVVEAKGRIDGALSVLACSI